VVIHLLFISLVHTPLGHPYIPFIKGRKNGKFLKKMVDSQDGIFAELAMTALNIQLYLRLSG
jgi:hypothetical protein